MNYYLTKEEVHNLNKGYKQYIDVFTRKPYTGALIYSKLQKVTNNTFYLEVFISKEWKKTPKETAYMFVNNWLNKTKELKRCTKYKVSIFNGQSLGFVLLTQNGFDEFIDFAIKSLNPNDYKKGYSLSNKTTLLASFKKVFNKNSFSINTTIYKLLDNLDLCFYDINYNSFLRVIIHDEADFYDNNIIGLPTVLKIEVSENKFIEYPQLNYFNVPTQLQYAVMTFKQTNKVYSTKAILNIHIMKLDEIKVILFDRYNKTKIITKANAQELKQLDIV